MAYSSFLNLAPSVLIISLSLLLLPHQPFASTRALFFPPNDDDYGPPQPVGICSAAVTIHGYKCQEFQVTTDDGYILSVQRIPEGRAGGGGGGPPVLLQHGVLV
ncbi:UNVERIFIED_CONTAM: Triacylglycerol lipase 2, partial [Sesamum radiatum]